MLASAESTLTLSNCKDKSAFVKGSEITVSDVATVKEYSCMQVLPSAAAVCWISTEVGWVVIRASTVRLQLLLMQLSRVYGSNVTHLM